LFQTMKLYSSKSSFILFQWLGSFWFYPWSQRNQLFLYSFTADTFQMKGLFLILLQNKNHVYKGCHSVKINLAKVKDITSTWFVINKFIPLTSLILAGVICMNTRITVLIYIIICSLISSFGPLNFDQQNF